MQLTKKEEREFRILAGASRCPVVVALGPSPPVFLGHGCVSHYRGGRRPWRTVRHSTRRVEVGEMFVAFWRERKALLKAKTPFGDPMTLDPTSRLVCADWLEEFTEFHATVAFLRSLAAS